MTRKERLPLVLFLNLLLIPFVANIIGLNYPSKNIKQSDVHSQVHPNGCGSNCLWIGKPIETHVGEVTIKGLTESTSSKLYVTIWDSNPETGKNYTWKEAINFNNPRRSK